MITYLVSGDANIRPSDENLRRSGRRVRFDQEGDLTARNALREGWRYVVVAHGRVDGTIVWFDSGSGEKVRWLWVGMRHPPPACRLYIYSCHAGAQLSRYFKKCKCFGHSSEVPMPTAPVEAVVLAFFAQVDRLVDGKAFDVNTWQRTLADYVDDQWERELEERTSPLKAEALRMLSESLRW